MLFLFICMMDVYWCLLAPAPIFAVKRPRQALFAHPNNYACDNAQQQLAGVATFLCL